MVGVLVVHIHDGGSASVHVDVASHPDHWADVDLPREVVAAWLSHQDTHSIPSVHRQAADSLAKALLWTSRDADSHAVITLCDGAMRGRLAGEPLSAEERRLYPSCGRKFVGTMDVIRSVIRIDSEMSPVHWLEVQVPKAFCEAYMQVVSSPLNPQGASSAGVV